MALPNPLPLDSLPCDISALVVRDGPYCVWCSRRIGLEAGDCTRDHLIAKSKGGKSGIDNYVLACKRCNSKRKSKTAQNWLVLCEKQGQMVRRKVLESALTRASEADMTRVSKLSKRARRLRRKKTIG